MKYKLDLDTKIIKSPVILKVDEQELHFENGEELAEYEFDKKMK